jgi:lipopolysaccharide transport protein LptA
MGPGASAEPTADGETVPWGAEETSEASEPGDFTDPVFLLSEADFSGPVSIQSDALEATDSGGLRTLVFDRNVEVRQGDLQLRTAHLEAVYPAGAKQPSHLRARGGVRVTQGGREARCDRAAYDRGAERIRCTGHAVMRDGADEIHGDSIVFDLAARRVIVEGGARVAVTPSGEGGEESGPFAGLGGEGPVTILADELQAWETPEGRRLVFGGSVAVEREDLTLRATEIEAFYPPGAEEPIRLVASGDVLITQQGREARCDRAEYRRLERRLDCRGAAQLQRGEDRVTGDVIAFDMETQRLIVSGDTRLVLAPREPEERSIP